MGEGGGEDPCPPSYAVLPKDLSREPEVRVGTITDDGGGGRAEGDDSGRDADAVALGADLPREGHTAACVPELRLQLFIQPLRTHQAHPGPVKVTQELGQAPGLVGGAAHCAEEGRELEMVGELGVLRSMANLGEEMGLQILAKHPTTHPAQCPQMLSPATLGLGLILPPSAFIIKNILSILYVINIYNSMNLQVNIHLGNHHHKQNSSLGKCFTETSRDPSEWLVTGSTWQLSKKGGEEK